MLYYVTDATRGEKPGFNGFYSPNAAFKAYIKNCKADATPQLWYSKDGGLIWHPVQS